MGCHIMEGVTEQCTVRLHLTLSNQASVDVVKQNDVKPKTKYAKKAVGELSSKAENVTIRLTTPKATCKKGKK